MSAKNLFAIVAVFLPLMAAAQSVAPPPQPLHLVGDHWTPYDPPTEFPEGAMVHTIVKGDTLWDLAAHYLGDPFLWPQIWERNPYIRDSHWIYPGDPIVIDVAVQEAPLSLLVPLWLLVIANVYFGVQTDVSGGRAGQAAHAPQDERGVALHPRLVVVLEQGTLLADFLETGGDNDHVTGTQPGRLHDDLLDAVGMTRWVPQESALDAITALSGSGPAYFFLFMEAMADAGRELGLDADTATAMTLQTALGAARMAVEGDVDLLELRRRVTSPGGTTERALAVLEEGGLRALFRDALSAARDRSDELSRVLGGQ